MTLKAVTLLAAVSILCGLPVQAYDKTVKIQSSKNCDQRYYLSKSETMGISYNAHSADLRDTCEIIVDASEDVAELCVEVVNLRSSCGSGAEIRYYPYDTSFTVDKEFKCSPPGKWCTTFFDIRIEIEPGSSSSYTDLQLKVTTQGGIDTDDIVSSAFTAVWVIVAVVVGCIVLGVIVITAIACYCCRRRSSGGTVYRTPQSAAMVTTTAQPPPPPQGYGGYPQPMVPQGAYAGQQGPPPGAYPPQAQGYQAGYQPGYQPPGGAYPPPAPQQQYAGHQMAPEKTPEKVPSAPPPPYSSN